MIEQACALAVAAILVAAPARPYEGTRDVGWSDETAEPEPTPSRRERATKAAVPRPVVPRSDTRIHVAVGLSPDAPGTKLERDLLQRLERNAAKSIDPTAEVRRLPAGLGPPRQICRDRRDDLVVLLGYVPDRDAPVVLAYDCRLDAPLPVRPAEAVDEIGLVGVLWGEHEELVRKGAKERRPVGRLSQKARIGIAASVAIVVIGVAVGLLVANALRKEKVVLKVEP